MKELTVNKKMCKNFNFHKHLTKDERIEEINSNKRKTGDLILIIMNDISSCVHSITINNKQEGIDFFHKWYDETHSYHFVYVA